MMQYSKGDSIKIGVDTIAIVLDNGLPGQKFFRENRLKMIVQISDYFDYFRRLYYDSDDDLDCFVFYYVLIGDQKVWYKQYIIPEDISLGVQIALDGMGGKDDV